MASVVGGGIFDHFSNFHKCRLDAAGGVISDMAVELIALDVRANIGDSRLTVADLFESLPTRIRSMLFRTVVSFTLQPTGKS